MKKRLIIAIALIALLLVLCNSCSNNVDFKYNVYEMRGVPGIGEAAFYEYDLWSPIKYEPETPVLERKIEFDGKIYDVYYESGSFEKSKGVEPVLYYSTKDKSAHFGIYEYSGEVCYVNVNLNYKEIYQKTALEWYELQEIADRYVQAYADVDTYYTSYSTFKTNVTNENGVSDGEYILKYTFEYYKKVNGEKCLNDRMLVGVYQDGSFGDLQAIDVGALDETSVEQKFDFDEIYWGIDSKIKSTERYSKYGEFDYMINSLKNEYYVFEDGEVGMEIQLYVIVFPEDKSQSSVTDILVYLIKSNN